MKKFFAILFIAAVFLCASCAVASGQTCLRFVSCTECSAFNRPPDCAGACPPFNDWDSYIEACVRYEVFYGECDLPTSTYQCAPAAGPQETRPCGTAGHPVCLANGNTIITQTDLRIPGLGGGLSLVRTWNSIWPSTQSEARIGLFGPNWRSSFEERVSYRLDGYMKYARSDGSFWSFGLSPTGNLAGPYLLAAPANVSASLVRNTNWELTFQSGERRLFDYASGNLTTIVDRNGNTTTLSYDSAGRLTTVTDSASRHLYFNYSSGSSRLVTGVTSDFGLSVSYSYDGQGRLVQVTEPDQSKISFQYDSNSLISAVLDSSGKALETHTYDNNGRGLTSSRANGVEAVTISYPTP